MAPLIYSVAINNYLCVTMIEVDKVYKLVNDLLSKQNGVTITPLEFDRYAEIASTSLFEEYRGANITSKTTYGRTRTLDNRLRPFLVHDHRVQLNQRGYGELPEDWAQTLSVRDKDFNPINPIDEDRIGVTVTQDYYAKPSSDHKVYEDMNQTDEFLSPRPAVIRVHPSGDDYVILTYLKKPTTPKYSYSMSGRRAEFNPITSVNFDWDSLQLPELTYRILQLCGVSMDKGQIINYTAAKQQEE